MQALTGVTTWYNEGMDLEDYMTSNEAAEALGVGLQRIYDLIEVGRLEAIQIAGRWLVLRQSVINFERKKPGRPKKEI